MNKEKDIIKEISGTLLLSYISETASVKERETVEIWLSSNEANEKKLLEIATIYYAQRTKQRILARNPHTALNKTLRKIKKRARYRHIFFYTSIAASLFLILTIHHLTTNIQPTDKSKGIEKIKKTNISTQNIQLILSDTKELIINDDESLLYYDKEGALSVNSKKVETNTNYNHSNESSPYNQLIVPAGKRSKLSLSDGSKIWVNANTHVVYPAVFNQKEREIYVDGEIFLEVSPNKAHPFIVKTNKFEVIVLGTSFNISAYETDTEASVVLVSGKVDIKTMNKNKMTLKPNEIYCFENGQSKKEIVNVENYISWRMGIYTFDNERLSKVLNKLSKYYGQKIIHDKEISAMYCSGSLDLQEDLMVLLKGLESSVPIKFTKETEYIKADVQP